MDQATPPPAKKPKIDEDSRRNEAEVDRRVAAAVAAANKRAAAAEANITTLQQENDSLKQMNGTLQQEKALIQTKSDQDKKAKSVLAVLCSKDFPPIRPLECMGLPNTHLYPDHDPAFFTEDEFKVHSVYPVVNVPDFDYQNLTSKLLAEDQTQYDNESDLRSSVNDAIADALKICNEMIRLNAKKKGQEVPFYLQRRTESTLFSNILDHVVIYDYKSNTPIFAVESKKDLPKRFDKSATHKVMGQCLDQLRELRFMGHICPFGALTSFNKTIVMWLDSEIHSEVLRQHKENGLFDEIFFAEAIDHSRADGNKSSQSPPKFQKSDGSKQVNKVSPDSQLTSGDKADEKRSIVCSGQWFTHKELVDVLVNAVCCSLEGFYHPHMTILNLVDGTCVELNDAIELTENSYKWMDLSMVYNGLLTKNMYHKKLATKKLYLISYLGRGATSKVYRAISETGHGCVVKLYVQRRDKKNKMMKKEDFVKLTTNLAIMEERNFNEIYPELGEYVWRDQLNKLQCLIMPFFDPIQKEQRKCDEVMGGIREKLQRFGQNGKMFRKCDQLWRHVGFFQNKIYLFDLGDLSTEADKPSSNDKDGDFDIQKLIADHLATLAATA